MTIGPRSSTSVNSYQSSTNLSESSPLISQTSYSTVGRSGHSTESDEKFYFVHDNAETTGYDKAIDIAPHGTEQRDFSSIPITIVSFERAIYYGSRKGIRSFSTKS